MENVISTNSTSVNKTACKVSEWYKGGMRRNLLSWISGEPGTGKGVHIKRFIYENPTRKVLVVQPTTELIDEFANEIPGAVKLHSAMGKTNLVERINKALDSVETKVLFITDKMYYQLDLYRLRGWKIFIDDCVEFCTVISSNKSTKDSIEIVLDKMFIKGDPITIDGKGGELDNSYLNFELCPKEDLSQILHKAWDEFNDLTKFHRKGIYKESFYKENNKIVLWGNYDIEEYTNPKLGLDITYLANSFENTILYKANKHLFNAVPTHIIKSTIKVTTNVLQ